MSIHARDGGRKVIVLDVRGFPADGAGVGLVLLGEGAKVIVFVFDLVDGVLEPALGVGVGIGVAVAGDVPQAADSVVKRSD
jgi:hypothetical protein